MAGNRVKSKAVEGRGLTVGQALAQALPHWDGRPGQKTMAQVARQACLVVGFDVQCAALRPTDGVRFLSTLRGRGLAASTIVQYYVTLRRVLSLNGVLTHDWPKAPEPPRVKSREPMSHEDTERLIGHLRGVGLGETADLAILLQGTGMRANIEALRPGAFTVSPGDTFDTLVIRGKGGHERAIPVIDPRTRALLVDPGRLERMRGLGDSAHLKRWRRAVKALGISSRLPTPHSLRHGYAGQALATTGGNLRLVQELLGHSDPKTTSRYIAVDMEAKAKALCDRAQQGEPQRTQDQS